MSAAMKKAREDFKKTEMKSDYKRDVKPAKGKGPTVLSKDEMEMTQLRNERARNPKEFDAAKAMYESASGEPAFKKGGAVKSSASKRADGCCVRGKTRA
jgi:hypothetical protein